jgi:hypothetical protein
MLGVVGESGSGGDRVTTQVPRCRSTGPYIQLRTAEDREIAGLPTLSLRSDQIMPFTLLAQLLAPALQYDPGDFERRTRLQHGVHGRGLAGSRIRLRCV